jgi:N-acyl homoserine lactone hydrolase
MLSQPVVRRADGGGRWRVRIIEVGVLPGSALAAYVPGALDDILFDLPCYAYLLDDGTTRVIVDSGPDAVASADLYEVRGEGSAAILGALTAAGLEPASIDVLVHTHLHQDHVQNDALFPRAEVVVQGRELDEALAGEARCGALSDTERAGLAAGSYASSQAAGLWYVGASDWLSSVGSRLRRVDGRVELLPGLTLIPSAGHTGGHQSVLVETADGLVCIAGDVVPLQVNREVVGPMTPDEEPARAFLRMARDEAWEIIPSHDPALRGHRWYLPPR